MRNELWKGLCCLAAVSVLFGMAACRVNELNADVNETDNGPTVITINISKDEPAESSTELPKSGIEDGWIAIIQNGAGERMLMTYVYKTGDGKFKYVNAEATTTSWGSAKWNKVVREEGTVDSREAVVEEAKKFKSDGFVLFAGEDSKTVHSIQEFLAGK